MQNEINVDFLNNTRGYVSHKDDIHTAVLWQLKTVVLMQLLFNSFLEMWPYLIYNLATEEVRLMQIVPIRDLKNTVEIERICIESGEPVFVTKNGYGRLVVMDIDYYEKTMRKIDEATLVNRGIRDFAEGNLTDGKSSVNRIRNKYGI